ncbi:CobIyrinic acid a,c-diamide adenosyltransferase mitochondrial precursor [Polychytrium aggregatum]|uniref:CobIyrinic acid a,c-diamide adenosyltransferase mitochondrial precursor n=1 Tax=Polychytrium aggregatum TaxID=110093 RepID=UPI0022FE0A6B|nr:CobIyrinic acid a,c-diamide adenosyltransferase mitochondrial precursor [Polychytrium aggregatum]KAI9209483.1 CobIyrinic acid a,c-diamide adenosyltransferase mitochondrial precursor [Polychytrium aggregatum]
MSLKPALRRLVGTLPNQLGPARYPLVPAAAAALRTRSAFLLPHTSRFHSSAMSGDESDEKRRIRIYTRTGDKGTSALYTGERRPKDDQIFEALGTTDELTSHLGLAHHFCVKTDNGLADKLVKIQCLLQDIGSNIATPRSKASEFKLSKTSFDVNGELVKELESWIDQLDNSLEPLTQFILPSGGEAACHLQIARSVCRRAERRVVPLVEQGIADASCAKYLNRLSDFLFTAGRFAAKHDGATETIYKSMTSFQAAK